MNNLEDRLIRCFESAFPRATRDEIRTAAFETFSGWDSLRGVTLLAVLDEEFGVEMDLTELMELGTFDAVKRHFIAVGDVESGRLKN